MNHSNVFFLAFCLSIFGIVKVLSDLHVRKCNSLEHYMFFLTSICGAMYIALYVGKVIAISCDKFFNSVKKS